MDYGEVLSRAWQIIWKHKVLWLFGILVSCTSANNGSGFPGANSSWQMNQSQFDSTINQIPDWQIMIFVGMVMLVVLFFVLLAIFLGTIGKIGLIRGTLQADQDTEKLSFGELFSGSLPYFWRVFLLNLIIGIAIAVAVIALILTICLAPLACLMIPVAWVVGVIVEQASVAIVSEDLGLVDGFKRGWEVVKLNPGPMLIMWLILVLALEFIGGFIIAIPLMFSIAPIIAGIVGGLLAEGFWPMIGGFALAALCFVAYLPFLIVLGGILRTYIGSAWTLTFLRLTAAEAPIEGEPLEPLPESL